MQLSADERQQVDNLFKNKRRPGMVIWMEPHADGDTYPSGFAQGDPFDMVMMALHAVDFVANAFGIKPEQAALNLAKMFSSTDYKKSNISGEIRTFK